MTDITLKKLESIIGKDCNIIPFENIKGSIVSIWINRLGLQYEVRYYLNAKQEQCYFLPKEIEIL